MNSDRREHEAGSFGDAVMIVLVFLIVLALFAGVFLWFMASSTSVSVQQVPLPSGQSSAPSMKKEAATPFADDDSPTPANPATSEPPTETKPMN